MEGLRRDLWGLGIQKGTIGRMFAVNSESFEPKRRKNELEEEEWSYPKSQKEWT